MYAIFFGPQEYSTNAWKGLWSKGEHWRSVNPTASGRVLTQHSGFLHQTFICTTLGQDARMLRCLDCTQVRVLYTELRKSPCTWFGELCYSCSLNALPSLAWVLLKYVLQRLFLISVYMGRASLLSHSVSFPCDSNPLEGLFGTSPVPPTSFTFSKSPLYSAYYFTSYRRCSDNPLPMNMNGVS